MDPGSPAWPRGGWAWGWGGGESEGGGEELGLDVLSTLHMESAERVNADQRTGA